MHPSTHGSAIAITLAVTWPLVVLELYPRATSPRAQLATACVWVATTFATFTFYRFMTQGVLP